MFQSTPHPVVTVTPQVRPIPGAEKAASITCDSATISRPAPKFSVIKDIAGLDALRDAWLAFEVEHAASDQMFQSFHWVRHWCEHFLDQPGLSLRIVTAHVGQRLVMIWPLVQECRLGQCQIKWLGEPVSQYGDVLVIDSPDTQSLVLSGLDYISRAFQEDIVIFRKVRADSFLARALDSRGVQPTSIDTAPYATLPTATPFNVFAQRYPAKARKNRRRHRRRLEEKHSITFEVVERGERARSLIHTAIQYKRRWLRHRNLVSRAFKNAHLDDFFATLPEQLGDQTPSSSKLVVFALLCDGHPVAINVAFRFAERILVHIAAYDPDYERYGPGALLFEASIQHCLENGVKVFDLLSPGDSYKSDWTDASVDVRDYALGVTRKGRAFDAVFIRRVRPAAKRIIVRMPQLTRPLTRLLHY